MTTSGQREFWIDRGGTFADVAGRRPGGSSSPQTSLRKIRKPTPIPLFRGSRPVRSRGQRTDPFGFIGAIKMEPLSLPLPERKGRPHPVCIVHFASGWSRPRQRRERHILNCLSDCREAHSITANYAWYF